MAIEAEKFIIVGPDGTEADVVAGVLQTGGGGGGGAVTIADGADVAEGAVADAVVAAGAVGSVSAKLRRLTADLGALILQIPTTLGQKTKANSLAVTLASDQEPPYAALTLGTGEKAGSASASQFATITTKWAKVKAQYDNAGRVYVGISGVTKADGSTDTTTGWQLVAGDETPWFPISNLNVLYLICDNAGDDVTYAYLV